MAPLQAFSTTPCGGVSPEVRTYEFVEALDAAGREVESPIGSLDWEPELRVEARELITNQPIGRGLPVGLWVWTGQDEMTFLPMDDGSEG